MRRDCVLKPSVGRRLDRVQPVFCGLLPRCYAGLEKWSGRLDSNQRPPAPKAGALPGCATPRPCDLTPKVTAANPRPPRAETERTLAPAARRYDTPAPSWAPRARRTSRRPVRHRVQHLGVTTVCRNAIVVSSKRRFALDEDPFRARADLQLQIDSRRMSALPAMASRSAVRKPDSSAFTT